MFFGSVVISSNDLAGATQRLRTTCFARYAGWPMDSKNCLSLASAALGGRSRRFSRGSADTSALLTWLPNSLSMDLVNYMKCLHLCGICLAESLPTGARQG